MAVDGNSVDQEIKESRQPKSGGGMLGYIWSKVISRNGFLGILGGILGTAAITAIVDPQIRSWLADSKTNIKSVRVYSPEGEGDDWNPGGVIFALENNGDRTALIDRALITVEDHECLNICASQGSYGPTQSCYDVALPEDPDLHYQLSISLGEQVKKDGELLFYSITFSVEQNKQSEKEVANTHLYLMDIKLVQSDDVKIDAGKFLLSAPSEGVLTKYWIPERVRVSSDSELQSRDRYLGQRFGEDKKRSHCYEVNEEKLTRIVLKSLRHNANMSPAVGNVAKVAVFGEYDAEVDVAPPQTDYDKPECS